MPKKRGHSAPVARARSAMSVERFLRSIRAGVLPPRRRRSLSGSRTHRRRAVRMRLRPRSRISTVAPPVWFAGWLGASGRLPGVKPIRHDPLPVGAPALRPFAGKSPAFSGLRIVTVHKSKKRGSCGPDWIHVASCVDCGLLGVGLTSRRSAVRIRQRPYRSVAAARPYPKYVRSRSICWSLPRAMTWSPALSSVVAPGLKSISSVTLPVC